MSTPWWFSHVATLAAPPAVDGLSLGTLWSLSERLRFIRDNVDEFPPAPNDFTTDNDQNVIVGALCISSTMQPRRENNTIDQDALLAESLLGYNMQGNAYGGQALGGSGTGNRNN